jgi:hypothetical protein
MKTVPNMLHDAADIYEQRNKIYGDNYKRFGHVMAALFRDVNMPAKPDANHWNRMGLLVQMVGKFTRYVENFNRGGHNDSLDDLAVYAMMLQEIDGIINAAAMKKEQGK